MAVLEGITSHQIIEIMLRPVLRFCLRRGICHQEFNRLVRKVQIGLAAEEIEQSGRKVSVSRLAAMTGIDRRDVTAIYRGEKPVTGKISLVARVISQWEASSQYQSANGGPRALDYDTGEHCFYSLVERVSKDVGPAVVLAELERLGLVECEENKVKLLTSEHIDEQEPDEGLLLLNRDMGTLIEAVEENLFAPDKTHNLHLRTEYDNIFVEDIPKIRKWLLRRGQQFHKEAREFLTKFDKDITYDDKKQGGGTVVLGAMSWTSPADNAD